MTSVRHLWSHQSALFDTVAPYPAVTGFEELGSNDAVGMNFDGLQDRRNPGEASALSQHFRASEI
jgi:hypothetical protein